MIDALRLFVAERAMDDATCRRVQAAMDVGVREPSEVIEDEMSLVEDVRRASHIEVTPAIFELIDAHLDAQRDAIAAFFDWPLEGREGVNVLRYDAGGFYKPHVDRADLPAWPPAAQRAFTVILFLESAREADAVGRFQWRSLATPAGQCALDRHRAATWLARRLPGRHRSRSAAGDRRSPRYGSRLVFLNARLPVHDGGHLRRR